MQFMNGHVVDHVISINVIFYDVAISWTDIHYKQ